MADWDSLLSEKPEDTSAPAVKAESWDAALSGPAPKVSGAAASFADVGYQRRKGDPKYDPSVLTRSYLWNEAKKVPGAVLGLVPDVASWLAQKLDTIPRPLGTTTPEQTFGATTRKLQDLSGADPNMKPPSAGVEAAGTILSNVAASVPFGVAAYPARGLMGVGTELLSGAAGGTGQALVAGGTKEKSPWLELAGNVAGSMAGFRAGNVVETLVNLGKTTFGALSSKEAQLATALKAKGLIEGSAEYQAALKVGMEGAKREVSNELGKAYAQEDMGAVQKVLDNYELIKQKFPGFKASLGEITGNEPALALQSKLESQNIPALEERGARIRANQAAIESARPTLVPAAPGGGRAALRGVQESIDTELRGLGDQETALATQLQGATESMTGAALPVEKAGTQIQAMSREGYTASKLQADKLYTDFREKVGANDTANVDNVLAKIKDLEQKFTFDKTPEIIDMVPGVAKEVLPERPVSFGKDEIGVAPPYEPGKSTSTLKISQLDDLSAAVNRDLNRERSKANPDRKVIAQLVAIREETQAAIRAGLEKSGNMGALSAYDAANAFFKGEHAPKYLTGVNLKLRLNDVLNEARIKPEDVVSTYFQPKGTTEARRFNTQFAGNEAAQESLARGVFDLYKREVIDPSGVIDPARHAAFMRKYEAPLTEYPQIARRLNENSVAGEIATRMEEVRDNKGEIATSQLAKAVGTRDVDAFIERAISDKRFMFDAMSRMSPENRRNMAVAVLNKAWDDSAKGSKGVNDFLANEDNAKLLFRMGFGAKEGAEHLQNLKLLASAMEMTERAPKTSPMKAITEDSLKAATGTTWLQVMSALRAMGRRPGSGDWFAMVLGGQFVKAKVDAQKNAILKENLFDPSLLSATIAEAKAGGASSLSGLTGPATERGKQIASKLWDLTKAALGAGAPTAALKRLPTAAVSSADTEDRAPVPPREARSGLEQVR